MTTDWVPQVGDRVAGFAAIPRYEGERVVGRVRPASPHRRPGETMVRNGRGERLVLTSTLRLLPDAPHDVAVQLEDAVARHARPARHRRDESGAERPHTGVDPQRADDPARAVASEAYGPWRHTPDGSPGKSNGEPPNGRMHAWLCAAGDAWSYLGQWWVTIAAIAAVAAVLLAGGFFGLLLIIDVIWGVW